MATPSCLSKAVLLSSKAFLWLLIFSAFACFGWITFVRPTVWYRIDPDLKLIIGNTTIPWPDSTPVLSQVVLKAGKNTTVLLGRDSPLVSGGSNFPVILQWGSVLLAAACTALLVAVHTASPPPAPLAPGATSPLRAAWIKLRLYATWPLPCRRFWSWCCGGINAMELLFAATWAGLAIIYLYYNTMKTFTSTAAALTPPPMSPGASPLNATAQAAASTVLNALFLSRRIDGFRKASGETLRVLVMVMFFPVSRSSFLKWVMGTDFSSLIKYHRWMSWWTLAVATLHGLMSMIIWGSAGELDTELNWSLNNADNVGGLIALIVFIVVACTSCAWFRQAYYNIFIHVHIIGFVLFTVFAYIHFNGIIYYIMAPLLLYGMDRAFRTWQLSTSWTRLRSSDMHCDGSIVTLRLTMAKAERMRPGQTVYLYAPGLSWLQTHPFSVAGVEEVEVPVSSGGSAADASSPTPAWALIVHIKVSGPWTRGLRKLAAAGNQSLLLQVEGPYDTSLDTPPASPVVVMIAGGTGVTPLLGLLRSYMGSGPACYNLPAPSTTYLLWTSRALCELRLLGADLLSAAAPLTDAHAITITVDSSDTSASVAAADNAASRKGPWIYAALNYTGLEACPDADGAFGIKQAAPKETAEHCSSPPRPLVAHPTSRPLVYAFSVMLAGFGGYAGLIAAAYTIGYQARTTTTPLSVQQAGTAEWFLIAMGIFFPPLIFLAIMSACRAALSWYQARSASSGSSSSSELGAEEGGKPAPVSGEMAVAARPLVVGPGYRLLPPNACSKGDQGISLTRGRPDVKGLLRRVRELHAGECAEIEVLVGGPPAMWDAVVDACCEVGTESHPPGGPSLRPRRVAHQH